MFYKKSVIINFVDTGAPPEPQAPKHVMGQPMMPKFDPSQALAKLKKSANVRVSPYPSPPLQLLRFSLDFCTKADKVRSVIVYNTITWLSLPCYVEAEIVELPPMYA